jgi:hypothetical protein
MKLCSIMTATFLFSAFIPALAWSANDGPIKDQVGLMTEAKAKGLSGVARKTKEVDARAAKPGCRFAYDRETPRQQFQQDSPAPNLRLGI